MASGADPGGGSSTRGGRGRSPNRAGSANRGGAGGGAGRGASDSVRAWRSGRRLALAAVFEAEFGQRTADAILERHLAETEGDARAATLARDLVSGVVAHRDTIDARIA